MNSFQVAVWATEEYVSRVEENRNVQSLAMICEVMADTHSVSGDLVYQDAMAIMRAKFEWQLAVANAAVQREAQKSSDPNDDK